MSPSVVRVGSWFTSPISSCIMLSIGILTVQCNPYNSSELEHRNEEQHSPSTTSPDAVLANNDSIFHPPTNTAEDAERYQPQIVWLSGGWKGLDFPFEFEWITTQKSNDDVAVVTSTPETPWHEITATIKPQESLQQAQQHLDHAGFQSVKDLDSPREQRTFSGVQCPVGYSCIHYQYCPHGSTLPGLPNSTNQFQPCDNIEEGKVCCKDETTTESPTVSPLTPFPTLMDPLKEVLRSVESDDGCPAGSVCIHYRSCVNGLISSMKSDFDLIRPSRQAVVEFGKPCGFSGEEVCCAGDSLQELDTPPVSSVPESSAPDVIQLDVQTVPEEPKSCLEGFTCINYRSCANGFVTDIQSAEDSIRPSLLELMEFGTPCGLSGLDVCCRFQRPSTLSSVSTDEHSTESAILLITAVGSNESFQESTVPALLEEVNTEQPITDTPTTDYPQPIKEKGSNPFPIVQQSEVKEQEKDTSSFIHPESTTSTEQLINPEGANIPRGCPANFICISGDDKKCKPDHTILNTVEYHQSCWITEDKRMGCCIRQQKREPVFTPERLPVPLIFRNIRIPIISEQVSPAVV